MVIETVNLHIVGHCNLKCRYCYGTFPNNPRSLPLTHWFRILDMLAAAGVVRVTFSGGEPTLHKQLSDMLQYAQRQGLQTSIISNGTHLTEQMIRLLDVVGLSLDSANDDVSQRLGRNLPENGSYVDRIREIVGLAHLHGKKLKINTVVTSINHHEDMNDLIIELNPFKWKPLQFTRVIGENDDMAESLQVLREQFDAFVQRHHRVSQQQDIWFQPESDRVIQQSYVMVDPAGRVFQHGPAGHLLSEPLLDVGLQRAVTQAGGYNRQTFESRGGHLDVRRLPVLTGALR